MAMTNTARRTRKQKRAALILTGLAILGIDATDTIKDIRVRYKGQLPDLFREGQGVATENMLDVSGQFVADTVLAKHYETYMPKDLADRLMEKGVWQGSPHQP
jgi:cytochrome c-type biogenesis protein CcmE